MRIAILTFPGFNEIDSMVALTMLGRVNRGWTVRIAAPTERVVSMNGLELQRGLGLEGALTADAVIVGSGVQTREWVSDAELLRAIPLNPDRQLVGAQCSGALVLAKLGVLDGIPACTDLATKPWLQEAGVEVLDQPFHAKGNIATAGGCLASQYLAGWIIARLEGLDAAERALHYVAPVGEKDEYVTRAMGHLSKYVRGVTTRT
jgi:transcriptional regulator GlxA family with amidase domain